MYGVCRSHGEIQQNDNVVVCERDCMYSDSVCKVPMTVNRIMEHIAPDVSRRSMLALIASDHALVSMNPFEDHEGG
jgi:hypothetical protein